MSPHNQPSGKPDRCSMYAVTPMTKFKIIVNCGPCGRFVNDCLSSLRAQSFTGWEAFVTVDPCGDDTWEHAIVAANGDPRIRLRRNEIRRYSMHNLVRAIARSGA